MIAFLDLQKINARHQEAFIAKTTEIINKGWYILGDEVQQFEIDFAKYCQAKSCIGVANGLDALILIFKAHIHLGNLHIGDQIIVPANTYIASILAILETGLIPVFVEPNKETFNIDENLIQQCISPQVKAILVVHLYGQMANMVAISEIALKNNLYIIEDAAQSHGAMSQLRVAQTKHQAAAYSFYPGKNLGALGDAGAVVTNCDDMAKTVKLLRNYGSEKKYYNEIVGVNSRLDEIQAAFLNVKLPFLNIDNERRRAIAKRYITEITNPKIKLPFWDGSADHVFHLFVIRTADRNLLQEFLLNNNTQTAIHYPIPPHKQNALAQYNNLYFPITEKIHAECLSLPISPVMTDEDVEMIIDVLNRY